MKPSTLVKKLEKWHGMIENKLKEKLPNLQVKLNSAELKANGDDNLGKVLGSLTERCECRLQEDFDKIRKSIGDKVEEVDNAIDSIMR